MHFRTVGVNCCGAYLPATTHFDVAQSDKKVGLNKNNLYFSRQVSIAVFLSERVHLPNEMPPSFDDTPVLSRVTANFTRFILSYLALYIAVRCWASRFIWVSYGIAKKLKLHPKCTIHTLRSKKFSGGQPLPRLLPSGRETALPEPCRRRLHIVPNW